MTWNPNKADVKLKRGKGLLQEALENYKGVVKQILKDSNGKYGYDMMDCYLAAKPYIYGYVVSVHKDLFDAAMKEKKPIVLYIGKTKVYYKFNPKDIGNSDTTFFNRRDEVDMINFSIKLGERYERV